MRKIYYWLLKFLELQLFVTACSLPIFVYWGLPVSTMTLLGNLIFSPILISFIFFSMLMLITELFYIPNGIIIEFLNSITDLWVDLLSFGKKTWFVGLKFKFFWFSFIPLILAFVIVKAFEKRELKVVYLGLLLAISMCAGRYFFKPDTITLDINSGKRSANILFKDKKLIVIDNGIFSKRSARSDIKYKILPEIVKITGINVVDRLELKSLNKSVLANLEYANSLMSIKEIAIAKKDILSDELNQFCISEAINIVS